MMISTLLDRLDCVKQQGSGFIARCPAHDDQNPSLSIKEEKGKILLHCHAGCTTESIVSALGLSLSDLFTSEEPESKDISRPNSSLSNSPNPAKRRDETVATYEYQNAKGMPLYRVMRTASKQFFQERWTGSKWERGLNGVKPVLFRLPELLATPLDVPIYICEGEKDVLACVEQGLVATCNSGGAGKFKPEFVEHFYGRRAVIVMDRDEAGRKHAQRISDLLDGIATSVQVVHAKSGKDAHDHFAAGFSVDEFVDFDKSEEQVTGSDLEFSEGEPAPYRERGGRIERYVRNRDGDSWIAVTENFTARIVEQFEIDDGAELKREYVIKGICEGQPMRRARVPVKEFHSLTWIDHHWGATPIVKVGPSNISHAVAAIKMLGRPVIERTIYTHLGWRKIGEDEVYLHAGGGIGAKGPLEGVETDLPNQLTGYLLEERVGTSPAEALRASLTFLRAATADVAGTLYAVLWRSVIGEVNFSVFVVGPTGTQKSSLTSALLSHFGKGMVGKENLGVQWSSTANAIEGLLFSAKDAILVVDDYVPSRGTMFDRAQMQKTASRVLRAAGNRAGRTRMFADGNVRPAKPPRALLVATGEDLPEGGSELRRTVVVSIESRAVDLSTLSRVQEHGHSGANVTAMASFVQWVAPQREELRNRLATATRTSRNGSRLDEQMAELQETVTIWGEFAAKCGLWENEIEEAMTIMTAGLLEVAKQQLTHSMDQDPISRFLDLLCEGLASGALVLSERENQRPENVGSKCFIGWEDDEFLYLLPSITFGAIEKIGMAAQRPLQQQMRSLHKMLLAREMVIPQGGKAVSVLSMAGKDTRVLKMPRSVISTEMRSSRSPNSCDGSTAENKLGLTTFASTGEPAKGVARNVAVSVPIEPEPDGFEVAATSTTLATPSENDGYVVIEC